MAGMMQVDQITNSAGTGAPSFPNGIGTSSFVAPTVQKFASGTGTYTTPTSPRTPLYLKVRMVGGGGGGASSGGTSNIGGTGGNSTFGTSLLTANGGAGGESYSTNFGIGGLGGTVTVNSPAVSVVALQ